MPVNGMHRLTNFPRHVLGDPPALTAGVAKRVPRTVPLLGKGLERLDYEVWRTWLWCGSMTGSRVSKSWQLAFIDPMAVNSCIKPEGKLNWRRNNVGLILDGDWDLSTVPLTEKRKYVGLLQHFVEGMAWDRTVFNEAVYERLARGRPHPRYESEEVIRHRWDVLDRMFEEIRSNGYKTQAELGLRRPWHEVMVCTDRKGQYHLVDGWHRLTMAHALRLERLPVIVNVTHKLWFEQLKARASSGASA